MLPVFQQAAKGLLLALGEQSLLRGTVACRVNVEHGVEVVGDDTDVVVLRSVATIESTYNPKVGDTLSHPDGEYQLDAIFANSGATMRFVLLKV